MLRRRLRTLTLWTAALRCVLIAVAFVLSARWQIVFQVPTSRGPALALIAIRTGTWEQKLIERFGDEYRRYIERTGRIILRGTR